MCSLCQVGCIRDLQEGGLKRIQYLPNRAANVAAYGRLGMRPIKQELDARLASVLYDEESLENEIAFKAGGFQGHA